MVVGDVIRVPEDAYRYGTGGLTLYVAEVLSRREESGKTWVEVRGRDVRPDGCLASRERFALVRVDLTRVVRVVSG